MSAGMLVSLDVVPKDEVLWNSVREPVQAGDIKVTVFGAMKVGGEWKVFLAPEGSTPAGGVVTNLRRDDSGRLFTRFTPDGVIWKDVYLTAP